MVWLTGPPTNDMGMVSQAVYSELINGLVRTHQRLYQVHSGKLAPTDRLPAGRSTAEIRLDHPTEVPPPK